MRPREETDWMLGEARASAGLEGWLIPDLTRPVVYVKDCFFPPIVFSRIYYSWNHGLFDLAIYI